MMCCFLDQRLNQSDAPKIFGRGRTRHTTHRSGSAGLPQRDEAVKGSSRSDVVKTKQIPPGYFAITFVKKMPRQPAG
jgi:hypothetical protein